MPELEEQLTALAGAIDWPATPALSGAVLRRARERRRWPRVRARWAMAAVAVLVIIATLLAYAPTRTAIAGWVNLHIRLGHTSALPTPSPLPSGTMGSSLGLGTQTTLQAAQATVGWQVLVPSALGAPDAVYLLQPPDGPTQGEVSLVYAPRPGIPAAGETGVGVLMTEARGSVNEAFFGKTISNGTMIVPVSVGGQPGWWISGQPHAFVFIDSEGNPRFETLRLATNTLVMDEEGTIVRIEGDLTESQAEQIAASLG
jgi:hypothetical protein